MNVASATDEGEDDARTGRTRAMSAHLRTLRAAFSRAPAAYAGVGAVLLLVLLVPWLSNSRLLALLSAPAILPVLPGASTLTFVAQGDWGRRGGEGQELVAPTLADWGRRVRTPLVISVGDNFYNSGLSSRVDEGVSASFTRPYAAPSLDVPWYAVLGNHDMRGAWLPCGAQAAGLDPRWVCPHPFYAAAWDLATGREVVGPRSTGTWAALATAGTHTCLAAVFIDTVPLTLYYRKPAYVKHVGKDGEAFVANIAAATAPAVQMAWVREALVNASAACDAVIVVGHHPVFSAGEHGNSEDLLRDLKPLLDEHGVDAYFAGHDHTLNHLVKDGVQYVLTGAGSEAAGTGPSRPPSGPPTPETAFLEDTHGFTVHSLNGSHMAHTYVRYDGSLRFQAVAKLRTKRRPGPGGA